MCHNVLYRNVLAVVPDMVRIEFSEAEKEALHQERFHHPHPRVQKKIRAIALGCHSGVSPSSAMRASSSQPMALRRRRRLFLGAEGAQVS